MLSLTDAHTRVRAQCAPDVDPALTDPEIEAIVRATAAASIWAPATAYAEGAVVVPTVPAGRTFICALAGTSDATEPSWLIAPPWDGPVNPFGAAWWGAGVVPFIENVAATPWYFGLADGTCAWRAFNLFRGEVYDVRAATRAAWLLKAQKASNRVDTSIANAGSRRDSQTPDFCLRMASIYQPMGFG